MPKQQKRPGDITGRKAEVLAEQNKEALRLRAEEISLMTATAAEERNHEVINLGFDRAYESDTVEANTVEVETPMRKFRVNAPLEQMTFGHGNTFDFEEGRTYNAPKPIYDHLEEMGYIYH